MRRFLSCLAVLITGCLPLSVTGDIVLRTSVIPEEAWIGQRVVLQIDVLGDSGWSQITRFGELEIDGAYLIRTDSQGTRLQETIGGVSYSGQRYELSIYPQVAGSVEVPAIPVEVTSKGWGADAAETIEQANAPAVSIKSRIPPGAGNIRGLVSTSRLEAEQQWKPSIEAAKVGDALERTVTLQAEDISAMAFMPLQHDVIPGVGTYPAEPDLQDTTNRGSLTGTRIERVTYVFERPGEVRLPDIRLTWWDTRAEELKSIQLPGPRLQVAAGPAGDAGVPGATVSRQMVGRLWPVFAVLALVLVLAVRFRAGISQWLTAWRKARKESETRYFRRAMRSLKSQDTRAGIRDTMRWLDRISMINRPARFDLFMRQYGEASLQESADQLFSNLVSGKRHGRVRAMSASLAAARDRWRETRRVRRHGLPDGLPGLNTGSKSPFYQSRR